MNREVLKTMTLFSLFTLCIILTVQLMLGLSANGEAKDAQADATIEVMDISSIFSPQSYVVSFGGGSYTRNYSAVNGQIWAKASEDLKTYLEEQAIVQVEEDDWIAASAEKSIRFQMPFQMTINMMKSLLYVDVDQPSVDQLSIDTLMIVSNDRNRLYLGSERAGLYYVLTSSAEIANYEPFIDAIDQSNVVEHHQMDALFGSARQLESVGQEVVVNNDIYPRTAPILDGIYVLPEVDVFGDEMGPKSFANKAFGRSVDFVKRMNDIDGSILYMYGYGERALVLGANGTIEYREQIMTTDQADKISFDSGLIQSMTQIERFGGIPTTLYLSDYQASKEGESIKQVYDFSYRMEYVPVYFEDALSLNAIRVEFVDGKFQRIRRNIRRYREKLPLSSIGEPLTFNEVLGANANAFLAQYRLDKNIDATVDNKVVEQELLNDMKHIQSAYYKQENLGFLIPVWVVDIADTRYYIKMHTGDTLKKVTRRIENGLE